MDALDLLRESDALAIGSEIGELSAQLAPADAGHPVVDIAQACRQLDFHIALACGAHELAMAGAGPCSASS
ncbi:hypothetical protein D3C80_2107950 [compost metagenome]